MRLRKSKYTLGPDTMKVRIIQVHKLLKQILACFFCLNYIQIYNTIQTKNTLIQKMEFGIKSHFNRQLIQLNEN